MLGDIFFIFFFSLLKWKEKSLGSVFFFFFVFLFYYFLFLFLYSFQSRKRTYKQPAKRRRVLRNGLSNSAGVCRLGTDCCLQHAIPFLHLSALSHFFLVLLLSFDGDFLSPFASLRQERGARNPLIWRLNVNNGSVAVAIVVVVDCPSIKTMSTKGGEERRRRRHKLNDMSSVSTGRTFSLSPFA